MRFFRLVLGFSMALMLVPVALYAQQLDSTHKQWKVFSAQQSTGTLCYIASSPTSRSGSAKGRGQVYLWVSARSHSIDEVSASSGFTYKGDVTLSVGSKPFKFFAQGDTAWAKDEATDKAIITAMKKGSSMTVQGTSETGASAKDTYSLSGFSAAYSRMKALCPK